jgi:LmbE family N-acetylglucosaminyl deacetylase
MEVTIIIGLRSGNPVQLNPSVPSALAIAAHPDDIEFVMAGTLLLLREAGWETHYFNLSTGNMGSSVMSAAETARVRRREAKAAAKALGAKWHAPICDDLQILYTDENIRRVCAVVREARPLVILTHALEDYMEDHMITARLTVTGTFARGMQNYRSRPQRKPTLDSCVVYHAMPHGQRTPLREPVRPEILINTTRVHETKRDALACHASQREWLDASQGQDNYLTVMDGFSIALGRRSRRFQHAEGWTRHLHYGFGAEDDDPLRGVLGNRYCVNKRSRSRERP